MLNVVVLIGRLTADPEPRYTVDGTAVTNFRLAVQRSFTNRDGEREADFLDVVCWRGLAETVAQNLRKGRLVAVHGRIQVRSWETQDGDRRWKTEIVADEVRFLDWPDDDRPAKRREKKDDDLLDDFLDDDDADVPFN